MSREYIPDGWAIIRSFEGEFFIFGSWYGDGSGGDTWRRNSGVVNYSEDEKYYYFEGYTGSVYICNKFRNRITTYNEGVLYSIAGASGGDKIVSSEEFKEEFNNG